MTKCLVIFLILINGLSFNLEIIKKEKCNFLNIPSEKNIQLPKLPESKKYIQSPMGASLKANFMDSNAISPLIDSVFIEFIFKSLSAMECNVLDYKFGYLKAIGYLGTIEVREGVQTELFYLNLNIGKDCKYGIIVGVNVLCEHITSIIKMSENKLRMGFSDLTTCAYKKNQFEIIKAPPSDIFPKKKLKGNSQKIKLDKNGYLK